MRTGTKSTLGVIGLVGLVSCATTSTLWTTPDQVRMILSPRVSLRPVVAHATLVVERPVVFACPSVEWRAGDGREWPYVATQQSDCDPTVADLDRVAWTRDFPLGEGRWVIQVTLTGMNGVSIKVSDYVYVGVLP